MRLCLKELREILRDRRTIFTLLLMPLLVYPLLSISFQRLLLNSLTSTREQQCRIGVESEQAATRIQRFLQLGEARLRRQVKRADSDLPETATASLPGTSDPDLKISWWFGPALEQQVRAGVIDLAILTRDGSPKDESAELSAPLKCELIYQKNSALGKTAMDYVSRRFRAVNQEVLRRRFGDLNLPTAFTSRTVGGSGAGYSLTTLIPLVLILMTITGAVYPAIDLTAGERERGTLEALMAAPVPRLGLLAAKYVAVMAVALLTAGANLLAMTITLVTSGLSRLLFGDAGLSPLVMLQILLLLILFAGFFSAVLLAVTSFARSFKEAQAYLIPLMLLSLAPALLSLTPGVEFNALLAMTPLVNMVLLARDLFEGGVDPILAAGAILSTVLYALAAIGVAARVFGTDAILYGSEATWSDLVRRPAEGRRLPSLPGALLGLAILFPCSFLVTGLIKRLSYDSIGTILVLNGVATVVLYGGFPLLVAIVKGLPLVEVFQLYRPKLLALLGGLLLGVSLWPMAHEIFLLNRLIGLARFNAEMFESARELQEAWHQISPWLILVSLALVPAVCEELLFRGYLMRALLAVASPRKAIVTSALLFGVFHVLTTSVLGTERLLPSTFLGLILGWVCWRSRSILPSILLHACHNGLLLMILYYQEPLAARGWGVEQRSHMPASWLCVSSVGVVIGLTLVWFSARAKLADPARMSAVE